VVNTGQRDQHLSIAQAGFLEGTHTGGATSNDPGIENLFQLDAALRVFLNDNNFISFSGQPGSYQSGHLAPTCNQDTHKFKMFPGSQSDFGCS
jgi:hypothetical protein